MKNVLFFLILIPFWGFGQVQLNYFNLTQHQQQVILSFEIAAGNTCNGISIERSIDGVQFTSIYEFEGICGDPGFAIPYNYTDHTPLYNQVSYYRLNFGGTEQSEIYAITIGNYGNVGYLIRSFSGEKKIEFSIDLSVWASSILSFYTVDGKLISKHPIFQTSAFYEFPYQDAQIILFKLESPTKQSISGKFYFY